MRFMDKVVFVTGGAQGIGRAIAEMFYAEGAAVAVNDINNEELSHFVINLSNAENNKGQIIAVPGDISEENAVADMIQTVTDQLGSVDILVNNAGISPRNNGKKSTVEEMTLEEWERVFAVNLRSQFLTSRAVISKMKERGWGRIINVSSEAARKRPSPIVGANYVASKTGVLGLTRCLAIELAPFGVTVNAICPGLVASDMLADVESNETKQHVGDIPVGRLGDPKDLANGIRFLADPSSEYITGAVLDVNGGHFMP
ncbi:3-oxoacyl-[acyl-carrier protein] reductase [Scopulibacillus darangshiensis]|uniref:3-oxoacyl-[acyl-carrier protein] reductase n=1 Tax=Scopulibacillus darangshiensis TaxID=442528 RepID=A0A4R2P9Y3_9BACL|nr:3-oxoacyl-ACP reductase family protein [Scopulibacillus darangshiensis]TCP30891.1 3-oxoacyl-[acyl-carrier protein] reductase [Scopulibacillus darangshiensis]